LGRKLVDWNTEAVQILKSEMKRRGFVYKSLSSALASLEPKVAISEKALSNRVSRGTFTFAFFLQCMKAMSVNKVTLFRDE